ncbi:Bax inhibitor-1/YccA family protein [Nakamurella aerolata]|uniref:Bax inhibitor-1/YccA family protein n=1 Tax=Nakamurella aerolata TaxID=1656892 RepID=A0A849A6J2_9ACTN|nr:Bax inhibitor-1/YccA family protein [Nakamurella aerolata]NNG35266.1 Bax inhibitor-1/YccA family protein [Nakamurella aerolata]
MQRVIDAPQAPTADTLQNMYNQPSYAKPAQPMDRGLTLDDVVAKTATLLGVALIVGVLTAYFNLQMLAIPGALVGFGIALFVIFKRSTNPALITAYSVAEGAFLGAVTSVFNAHFPGIAYQAVLGTAGVFIGMLIVYKTGVIRVTPKFTKVVVGAMIGLVILMLANLVASFFIDGGLGLRDGGTLAIIFSVVAIIIAALSFMLDFEAIDQAIKAGAPAKTAWYFSFGLMVTLVWLYLEILRLLGYLRSE